MEEAKLTTRTSAEAEVEDANKAEDDSKEEDSTTKAEALTTMEEEDSKAEDSTTKDAGLEEAEATSTQTISTSNIQMFPVTTALSQVANQDSSLIGTVITTRTHTKIKILETTAIQMKDGRSNC